MIGSAGLLSAAGLLDFAMICLYQVGVIRHLPDPPGRIFDSDRVNGSPRAFAFGVPDGTTGALLYAATLVLASAGGSARTGRRPAVDLLLGAAAAVGAGSAAYYLLDMAAVGVRLGTARAALRRTGGAHRSGAAGADPLRAPLQPVPSRGGGGLGSALNDKPLPEGVIRLQVRRGLGAMPAFGEERLSEAELDDIVAYLRAIR